MSSIQVPELCRQKILQDELEVGKSRLEQTAIRCRQQLSTSHTLGVSVNGGASNPHLGQIDIESENGKCISSQEHEEVPIISSSCKAFCIRGYVANIRETDISKCWPFPLNLLQRRMFKNTVALLPPLEVPTFRYWECLDCLASEFNLDRLNEINNDQEQLDNLMNVMPINGDANFPIELSENEHEDSGSGMKNYYLGGKAGNVLDEEEAGIEAAQCVEIDERSGDASVENHKEIHRSEERVTSHRAVELTSKNVADGDNLYSNYEVIACNATVWPTDSEETSSAKQMLSGKDDDQILSNCTSQLRAETYTSMFTQKEDQIKYMHCPVNKTAMHDLDENAIFQENIENTTAEESMETLISKIQGDDTLASSIVANFDKEGCITKVDTDGIPPIVKKCSSKKQKSRVKILKKRLISDLITVVPNEQQRCNEDKVKHMSRREKIDMQRVSKASIYSSQKVKAQATPNLESVDDKTKLQCQGISCQSLPPEKSVKEEIRAVKRHFGSKNLRSPPKKLISESLKKKAPAEEVAENRLEKQEVSRSEDDLLNELAHFMAQNQFERHATAPRFHNRRETQFLKDSLVHKSGDPILFHNNQCLKDKLVKGTDTSTKHAAVDGEGHLRIEDRKKINIIQESGKHDKQETSGQTVETDMNLDAVVGLSSSSNHQGCKNTEKVDENLKRDASDQSVGDKDIIGNSDMIKDQRKNAICTLQTKSIEHLGTLFQSNRDDSGKCVTVDSETHLLVEDGKNINQVQQSGKLKKQKTSGKDKEAYADLGTVIGISSSSDKHTCQNTETVDRNMKIDSSDRSVCNKGSTGNNVMVKAMRNSGSYFLKKQSNEHLGKSLKSNRDQFPNIEQCSASLDAAIHGLSATIFEGYDNGLDELVPFNPCKDDIQSRNNGSENPVPKSPIKDTSLNTLQTVAETKKRNVRDSHRITTLALDTGRHCTLNKEVKQFQLDGSTAPTSVRHLFQFDALGNPPKSNHDQPFIIEESNLSLDASIHGFSATSLERNNDCLAESIPSNSHNNDLHHHSNFSEQAAPMSKCKGNSLNTSQTVEVTTNTEVWDRQRISVLSLGRGKDCAQNMDVKQVQADSTVAAQIRAVKRHFGSKNLRTPRKEVISESLEKKVPAEEVAENGLKKQEVSRSEDDLLNELAHFRAQNQFERHATAPRFHNRRETQFLKDSLVHKSGDPILFHNNQCLKDKLVKGTDTSTKHAAVDGEGHLNIEDCKKINIIQESIKHDKQETSGQTVETDMNLDAVVGLSSSSNHQGCKNTEKVDKNLKRDASDQSVGDKDIIGNSDMIKDQRKNAICTLQTKSIEHLGTLLQSNRDDSGKCVTVDSETHLLVEDGKNINQVQQSGKLKKQKTSGKDKEAYADSGTVIGISSSSDKHTCQNTETVDRNMKMDSSDRSVCNKGSTGNNVMVKAMRNSGSYFFKKQSNEHLGKSLKSNRDQLPNIEQCSASLDASIHGLSATIFEGYDNGFDELVPFNPCKDDIQSRNNGSENPVPKSPCKDTSLNTLETVAVTKKRNARDSHRITTLALDTGRHCTLNKEVKQVQLDGSTAPSSVRPLFQFDALGNPPKSNHAQPFIIEESNVSLDASIHGFSATILERNNDCLAESIPSNSHNNDLHHHSNFSEQAAPMSKCKGNSLNTSQTVEVTTNTEVWDRQRISVLSLGRGKDCAQNMDVKQLQPDSSVAAQIRAVKRHFGSKNIRSPRKKLISESLKKTAPAEELAENGLEKQEVSRSEDDLLNELAHFRAQNQFERHATAPRFHNRRETQFLKDSLVHKSGDPILFHNNQCLKDKLVKGTDTSTKHAAVDGEGHLRIEDCKKINIIQESGKHDKQETSGQTVETDMNLDAVVGLSSSLNHQGCKNTEKVDKNLKRDASDQSVGDKDIIGNSDMIKDQRKNAICTLQTKSIEHLGTLLQSNRDDSAKCVTVDSETHLLVEDGKNINQVQQSGKLKKQKTSGKDKEAYADLGTVIGISSSSDKHTCQNTETVDRNMKIDSSDRSVFNKGSTGNNVMVKAMRNSGSYFFKKHSNEHLGKSLKSNHDQLPNIEQCSASLDTAIDGLSATFFEGYDNGFDELVPFNTCKDDIQSRNNGSENPVPKSPCKDTSLNTLQTVAETKKRNVRDSHRITALALDTGRHCTLNKEVKQVQLDGTTAPTSVRPLFQFDALGNPPKSNHDQPFIIEESNVSLDASIHGFSATTLERNNDCLTESIPSNSHNNDLHDHSNFSEQAAPMSECKGNSLNTSRTVEVTAKTEVGDRQRTSVLSLGRGKDCAQNMDVKEVQPDSSLVAQIVLPHFQSNVLGETSKSNCNQQCIFEQSSASLDASIDSFSTTGECHDNVLDQSVPSSSHKDSLHSQNIDLEHSVPESAYNDTSLNTYKTVAVTTFLTPQINTAVSVQPDLSLHCQSRLVNPNLITDFENSTNSDLKASQLYQTESYLKDFSMEHKPSNKIGFQPSFDCNLPCNTMNTSSLGADPMTNADEKQPLRSPVILSFAQGNKLDTQTTISRVL